MELMLPALVFIAAYGAVLVLLCHAVKCCACLGAVTFSWALGWTKDLTGSFTPGLVGLSVACAVSLTAQPSAPWRNARAGCRSRSRSMRMSGSSAAK